MVLNIIIVAVVAFLLNIFLGVWRKKYRKMTLPWWLLIHASIPVIIPLRIMLNTPKLLIPVFIGLAFLGQLIGSKKLKLNEVRSVQQDFGRKKS